MLQLNPYGNSGREKIAISQVVLLTPRQL